MWYDRDMRLDKFLKVSRLIKRRTVANEVSDMGRISVNGSQAKPAKQIKENDIMGIGDAGILSVGKDINETTKELIESLIDDDSSIVSIYYGSDIDEAKANELAESIQDEFPDIDVEEIGRASCRERV